MDFQAATASFLEAQEQGTATLYEKVLRYFAEWFPTHAQQALTLENWTTPDTRAWLAYLTDSKGLATTTVNSYRSCLSSFVQWCIDEKHMTHDPVSRVKGRKCVKSEPDALSRPELNALLRALQQEDESHRFILIFLLHTGLRRSELVSLTLDDIELGERKLSGSALLETLTPQQFRSGIVHVRDGKGHKARSIPLNESARSVLIAYLAKRPETDSRQLLISLKHKGPVSTSAVKYICRKYAHLLRRRMHPHLLRRTFATQLLEGGASLETVADALGHGNIQTTREAYLARGQGRLEQAINQIDEGML